MVHVSSCACDWLPATGDHLITESTGFFGSILPINKNEPWMRRISSVFEVRIKRPYYTKMIQK